MSSFEYGPGNLIESLYRMYPVQTVIVGILLISFLILVIMGGI